MGPDQITDVEDQLFNLLARCISSEHFQVGRPAISVQVLLALELSLRQACIVTYSEYYSG